MKIPGLSHEAIIRYDPSSGVSMIELKLRGDLIASAPLKSASESGILKGLTEVTKSAEILHQIPDSILKDLAQRLSVESGYVEAPSGASKSTGGAGGDISPEIEEKLNQILAKLEKIETRLSSIEQKWG